MVYDAILMNAPNVYFLLLHFFYSHDFCTLQESLKELFPSWEHIKIQEEVIVFTCGLMEDPTHLVDHVYENFIEMLCNVISTGDLQSNDETRSRLLAQGKDIDSTNLFHILYTESRVPLFGHADYNQFVCINENHEGEAEIDTPSKMYVFSEMSEDNVPVPKFAEQDGREEAPECVMWIQEPDAAAVKNLLSTCCQISKRQPVTHFMIRDATCENLTLPESLTLSRNAQGVCVINCDLPIRFWKNILHQLFNCLNLQNLWFENKNLHQLEEDLHELLTNIDSNTGLNNHQVEVVLRANNFSSKFLKKVEWIKFGHYL